jgi:hypothetical protein
VPSALRRNADNIQPGPEAQLHGGVVGPEEDGEPQGSSSRMWLWMAVISMPFSLGLDQRLSLAREAAFHTDRQSQSPTRHGERSDQCMSTSVAQSVDLSVGRRSGFSGSRFGRDNGLYDGVG